MKLDEYRTENGLSYKKLGEILGFSENKVYRFCRESSNCVKLVDAYLIQRVTEGKVLPEDLINGDC